MLLRRIFVTSVAILATLALAAGCTNKNDRELEEAARRERAQAALKEGTEALTKSETIRQELSQEFRIIILDYPLKSGTQKIEPEKLGQNYNWRRLSLEERQAAKEKLAQYGTLISKVIEIDSRRGIYVTHMNKIRSRKMAADAFQDSLNNFEEINGPTFNPPKNENERVYIGDTPF